MPVEVALVGEPHLDRDQGGGDAGPQFSGMAIASVPSATSMWIRFSPYYDGAIQGAATDWLFEYDATGGHYLAMGNQRQVAAFLGAHEQYDATGSASQTLTTGILLTVNDPSNYLGSSGSVVLSGPGISATTHSKSINLPRLTTHPPYDEPGISMTDAQVNQCPTYNLTYTLALYDSSANLLDSYALTLPMRPALSTELSASSFLAVTSTSPVPAGLVGWSGGIVSATWTRPDAINADSEDFWIELSDSSQANHVQDEHSLSTGATSGPAAFPAADFNGWTVQHGYWAVGGQDTYLRIFETTITSF